MFLPGRNQGQERKERRSAFSQIETWCLELVPDELRQQATLSVQEMLCGDPNCSPIDTAITILFESGGQGIVGIPMEAKDITLDDVEHVFPPPRILQKWHAGQEADWPEPEPLRFFVGQHVLCRTGPTDWNPGTILQLWYRQASWPPNNFAPYKIRLDDGRCIFAPADIDQVIRLNPDKQQPEAPDLGDCIEEVN